MFETLSAIFQRTGGAAIEINERRILPIFQMKLPSGRYSLLVRRLQHTSVSEAGLRIKILKGEVELNGQNHSEIILWAGSSPELVELCVRSKTGCTMKIWNVWRSDNLVQAWVGDAGMIVSEIGNSIKLECSGGDVGINFLGLVVQIDLKHICSETQS